MQQPADVASGAWRKERAGERKERVTRASSPSTDRNGELSQLGESRPLLTHDAHEYEAAHAWGGMSAWPASGQHCSKQQCAGKKRWTQAGRSLGKQRAGRKAISREEHGRSLLRSDLALARESRQRRVGQRTRATKKSFFVFCFLLECAKLAFMLFFCPSPYLREASFGFLENRGGRIHNYTQQTQ